MSKRPKRKPIRFTKPRPNIPLCWECNRLLYGGGRVYRTVEIDGVERHVHASCLLQMERDAR